MKSLLLHLRLPFQAILAPLFLWGFTLAGGRPGGPFLVAFVAVHIFVYGGITAFNSYYDRDEGPISTLAHPPAVTPALLPFSLVTIALGLVLTWTINPPFFWLCAGITLLGLAYSHPAVRLKAHPLPSVLTVAIGQGAGGTLAGWLAARGDPTSALAPVPLLAMLGAALITTGLFPLTQLYQVEEDRQRGDETFVVHWGQRAAFRFTRATWLLALPPMALVVGRAFSWPEAAILAVFLVLIVAGVGRWARGFQPAAIVANYARTMRLAALVSAGFGAYLVAHLLLR